MNTTARRRGVTLVELMVICAILGVLMGMVMFALQGANEQARADRTRAEVVKINDLIMSRWEGYRQRPMPMRLAYAPNQSAVNISRHRLNCTWELMRMELPERITDVRREAVYLRNPNGQPLQPALWRAYRRKLVALTGAPDTDPTANWTDEFSNSECLYLILSTLRENETTGLDYFTTREIGDTDGDGVPEILDGWGRPIRFLRWAPGFSTANGAPTRIQTGDPATHSDPFDPYKLYPTHFALVPLIYSAGPDGRWGVEAGALDYATTSPPNDPFASLGTGTVVGAAKAESSTDDWLDNITNHLTVVR